MIETERLTVKKVSAQFEKLKEHIAEENGEPKMAEGEERFVVRIKLFNPESRTIYAYKTRRRVLYDNSTRKLTICLHDNHINEDHPLAQHLTMPKFLPLEGKSENEIKLSLPKIIKRILSAGERGGSANFYQELRVAEAEEIEVEIAHQDTPFYYNPKMSNAAQLRDWGRAIVKSKFKIDKPREGK